MSRRKAGRLRDAVSDAVEVAERRSASVSLPPFAIFFDHNREVVYRYLLLRVGAQEVDDCFQETFLSALRAYTRVRPDSHLRAWVLKIAERKAIDAIRARSRRPSPQEELPEQPTHMPYADPQLWKAVQELPTRQAVAVALRYIADLPYKSIADFIDSSEGAARQSVREGLKKLRKVWVSERAG